MTDRIKRMQAALKTDKFVFCAEKPKLVIESWKKHEGLPSILRRAHATADYLDGRTIYVDEDELIVGRGGPEGRYGILYPELEGAYFATAGSLLESAEDMPHHFSEQDIAAEKKSYHRRHSRSRDFKIKVNILLYHTRIIF